MSPFSLDGFMSQVVFPHGLNGEVRESIGCVIVAIGWYRKRLVVAGKCARLKVAGPAGENPVEAIKSTLERPPFLIF